MNKKVLHTILSVLTSVILLLPIAVQFVHILEEEHEHIVCKSENIQHIHKVEIDCSVYHFQQHVVTTFNLPSIDFISIKLINSSPISFNDKWSYKKLLQNLNRGPPFILS